MKRRTAAAAAALLALAAPSAARAERDPFEAPAAARAAVPASAAAAPRAAADPVIRHLLTVDGQRWVLDGGRRHGVGDRLGSLQIECIHDRGVTVRDAAGRRRELPLFDRVTVTPSAAVAPAAAPAACADAGPPPRRLAKPAPPASATVPAAAPARPALPAESLTTAQTSERSLP